MSRGEARIGRIVGLMADTTEEEGEPQEKVPEAFEGGERLVVLIVRCGSAGFTGLLSGTFE